MSFRKIFFRMTNRAGRFKRQPTPVSILPLSGSPPFPRFIESPGDAQRRIDGESWRQRAACQHVDPETFFPEKGHVSRAAKQVCSTCPVQRPCLTEALREPQPGIWGGTTERERARLRMGLRVG